jgi:hypothetical protein
VDGIGPNSLFPYVFMRFFNKITEFDLNLTVVPSILRNSLRVRITIPFTLDFFTSQLLGFVSLTEDLIKLPVTAIFLLKP